MIPDVRTTNSLVKRTGDYPEYNITWQGPAVDLHSRILFKKFDNDDKKMNTNVTNDRIFLGALVKAYSRPVIPTKISLKAPKM